MSDTRVILIGGPPASGKSTLARKLAARLGYGCISTDDIGVSARAMTTLESHPNLHSMDSGTHKNHFLDNTADWLVENVMSWHAEIWPAIKAIIRAHTVGYSADPVIIVGMALWPERVSELEYPSTVSFWLGMTADEIETRTWERTEFDYQESAAEGVTAKFIARNVLWNHLMQEAVNRLGLELLDTTPIWSTDELAQHCVDRFNL